ncbi:proline-rich protein 11 [Musca domestica]|uniref:Proline-rich protein 11 n=1 Tax=Musca domestica TaxID=7370 RepID=A0A1I8N244_MUSDO|nr:proline-rich protein 11 [Musca domestica]
MILAARKHLFATNIIFFFIIFVVQKFIQLFCIIEEKACKNANCPGDKRCDERCVVSTGVVPSPSAPQMAAAGLPLVKPSSSSNSIPSPTPTLTPTPSPPPSPTPPVRGLRLIPMAMRKNLRNFGFGEGHFQLFVEEKQRQKYISKSRLNAAVAEVKLNPN